MKSKILLLSIALLSISACTTNSQNESVTAAMANVQPEKQRYTAYNIWLLPKSQRHNFKVINYKLKNVPILPAGTPVNSIKVSDSFSGSGASRQEPYFKFSTLEGKTYTISFTPRYHPGKTAKDYEGLMFSSMSFTEKTATMTSKEVESIKAGVIREGMSKPAVIMSYGYPPEHRTPDLMDSKWTYWMSKNGIKTICFGEDKNAIRCGGKVEIPDTL